MFDRLCLPMLLAATLTAAIGCDIETTPTGDASNSNADTGVGDTGRDGGSDAQVPPVETRVHTEAYGIGARWYNYNGATHAVTPREQVYRFGADGNATAVRITTYYNDRGTSGHIDLKVRHQSGQQWGPIEKIDGVGNIKDQPVCVDLEAASTVDCAEETADLMFRTDLRVVPAAGFAVQNPAVYTTGHYTDDSDWVIGVAAGTSLESLPDDWSGVADARLNPDHGLLSPYLEPQTATLDTPVMVQATADFELALWQAEPTTDANAQSRAVKLSGWCTELAKASGEQEWVNVDETESRLVEWPAQGGALIDLCAEGGPRVVQTYTKPLRGGWPDSDTFGLVLESFGGRAAARIAPGHLIQGSDSDTFKGPFWVPPGFWE